MCADSMHMGKHKKMYRALNTKQIIFYNGNTFVHFSDVV